jgi:hypothetical protein
MLRSDVEPQESAAADDDYKPRGAFYFMEDIDGQE